MTINFIFTVSQLQINKYSNLIEIFICILNKNDSQRTLFLTIKVDKRPNNAFLDSFYIS